MPMLLCEYAKPAEVSQERGKTYLYGPAFLANEQNLNGRTYSEAIIQKSVDKLKQRIAQAGGMLGEFCHSPSGDGSLDPNRISHIVKSVRREGQNIWNVKSELLNEGAGKIARSILDISPNALGYSMKGTGELHPDGRVKENYNFHQIGRAHV